MLEENFNLVLNYLSPEWVTRYSEELNVIFKDKRIIACYIPIHSGDDRILVKMGREYKIKEILKIVKNIKKTNPEMVIKTNFILAFPSETWIEYFKSCLDVFAFDLIAFNVFSARPGTPAYSYPNQKNKLVGFLRDMMFYCFVFPRQIFVVLKSFVLSRRQL